MASFARTWLGDGRTPKLPSQDIGAPFSRCYPPVNHPQVPGGCPLTTRSLALSLSLYLTLSFTFSKSLSRSRVFSASSFRSRFNEIFLPIVQTTQPVDARYLLARGHRHVVVKYGSPGESAPNSSSALLLVRHRALLLVRQRFDRSTSVKLAVIVYVRFMRFFYT